MPQDEDGVTLISLAPDEEPDASPHVIVLHALSGEYRVLVVTGGGLETANAPVDGSGPDLRESAIAMARRLAVEHGLAYVYVRDDG